MPEMTRILVPITRIGWDDLPAYPSSGMAEQKVPFEFEPHVAPRLDGPCL
jgi:hypothetical protein